MGLIDDIPLGARILLEASTSSEDGDWVEWDGGTGTYHVFGTFDGDSAKLQASLDGGNTATDIDGASWTTDAVGEFSAGSCLVRAVSSISGDSSINVVLSDTIENG